MAACARSLFAISVSLFAAAGCAGGHERRSTVSDLRFVPAPAWLTAECHSTARRVGYAVPCPTRVPAGLRPYGGRIGCALDVIGAGGTSGCSKAWEGWVAGSSAAGNQHLAVTASPTPLRSYAKAVNGPGWQPAHRVQPRGWVLINGRRMREVFVPSATNEGSVFSSHLVFVWTVAGHTYVVGFHNVRGLDATRKLDIVLARSIRLVSP
jgi:hypothetical protein